MNYDKRAFDKAFDAVTRQVVIETSSGRTVFVGRDREDGQLYGVRDGRPVVRRSGLWVYADQDKLREG